MIEKNHTEEGVAAPEAITVQDALEDMDKNFMMSTMAKNVFFCLDYSGSMGATFLSNKTGERSTRIKSANENLLNIFDNHVADDDHVGFLRFDHMVDTKLYFQLEMKGPRVSYLRGIISEARITRGGTRMYFALNWAVDDILKSDSCGQESWIVALTDGSSMDGPGAFINRVIDLNRKRRNKIHLVIVGVEVLSSVVEVCRRACTVSSKSVYIDSRGGLDAMNEAFEQVAAVIAGVSTTMETF